MRCLCRRGLLQEPEEPEDEEDEEEKRLKKMPPGPRTRAILASGALRLLSAEWLLAQGEGYILQRMQDLPEEAFLHPKRASELFDELYGVIVISYGWLSKKHPDPTGFHMRTILRYLRKHTAQFDWFGYEDYGVFWDFASLPQDHPHGTEKTEQEKATFKKGLGAISLLYGGRKTIVIQLTRMPEELQLADGSEVNLTEYAVRGWCFFEATVSGVLKPASSLLDLGAGAAALDSADAGWSAVREASTANRQPPLLPKDMAVELQKRRFTNGSDTELVTEKYGEFFAEAAGPRRRAAGRPRSSTRPTAKAAVGAEQLWFQNLSAGEGWGDAEVTQLARALPSFKHCRILRLSGHRALGERGLAELRGALPRCHRLRLLKLPAHLEHTAEGQALERRGQRRGVRVVWSSC